MMNRRTFLKIFSVGVTATVPLTQLPTPTPIAKVVEVAKNTNHNLASIIEIPIDRFNTMRITKLQYLTRWKSFNEKGYELQYGNKLIYRQIRY